MILQKQLSLDQRRLTDKAWNYVDALETVVRRCGSSRNPNEAGCVDIDSITRSRIDDFSNGHALPQPRQAVHIARIFLKDNVFEAPEKGSNYVLNYQLKEYSDEGERKAGKTAYDHGGSLHYRRLKQ
jgi:hypothetical protein